MPEEKAMPIGEKRQPLPSGQSVFDLEDTHPEQAVVPDPEQEQLKKDLDRGLKDSFPASDPPAVSQPTTPVATEPVLPAEQDERPGDRDNRQGEDDGYPLDRGATPGPMSPARGGPPD